MKIFERIVKFQLCIVGFHRYGHLALEPEIFLAEREMAETGSILKERVITLWSFGPLANQSNKYLASKWRAVVHVIPSWIVNGLHEAGVLIPVLKLEEPKLSITGSKNGLDHTSSHMSFSREEIAEGNRLLKELGIDLNQPYVCLIVRDGGHYLQNGEIESEGIELINFDIDDFAEMASELMESGFQVIRMGSGAEKPFLSAPHGVIDYALSSYRSEFLDVYIAATCEFAVSTQTGPDAVCMLFRRPVLYVDITRFGQYFFGSKIATWSPVRLLKNGNILKLSEIVFSDIAWYKDLRLFAANGIVQQKSNQFELRALVALYVKNRNLPSLVSVRINSLVEEGMGEKGRRQFGSVTSSQLHGCEEVLGEWVYS